jgi:catechol 2,3-dioxygenase-like lactoylglutathione lyase family enzyme
MRRVVAGTVRAGRSAGARDAGRAGDAFATPEWRWAAVVGSMQDRLDGGAEMSLSRYPVSVQIAVSDMDRAAEFYERRLGLAPGEGSRDGSRTYPCGAGTSLHVYASPGHAGKATATVARWDVADLEQVIDELTASGVTFEHYEEPVQTDEKGIHDSGYGKVAWFRDPDGNTFAVEQR